MHKQLGKNKKALSSLALILLLLISAIIGGLISYLWVMGYYISLKEKIPEENTAAITSLSFNPQDAKVFNATVLNPSYSPDEIINVTRITINGESENTLHDVVSTPSLPFSLSRGTSQTFTCISNWAQYVNQTVTVSASVQNGSGSTSATKLPYTGLSIAKVDFNSTLGVKNFTITLRNNRLSATYLNITKISVPEFTPPINFTTLLQPALPFALFPNDSKTFWCNYNWLNESRLGGSYELDVETEQGYFANYSVQIPQLAFAVQGIKFDPADTTHFNVTVKNQVSTNTYLNVSGIQIGNTTLNVTPLLNPSTNGVLGSSTATFKCAWNWTNYRNTNVIVTVYTLQGVQTSGQQQTPQAALLSIPEEPVFPDIQHFVVTVKNSQYSVRAANVTKITLTFLNGTEREMPIVQPAKGPYLIPIGNETMFSCSWNWANNLDKTVNINIYTDEGFATFRVVTTPMNTSNYQTYLTIPHSPGFNASDTTHFYVEVNNSPSSNQNATITRIAILANGTKINVTSTSLTLPFALQRNNNATFSCQLDWTKYRNESIVILIYTDEGLKAIYVTKTPS